MFATSQTTCRVPVFKQQNMMLIVVLVALLSGVQGQGGGSCKGVVDCNARYCLDCTCVDGKCECADGFGGAFCETPFCQTRSNCSDHGECVATRSNITCACDPGYSGPRCKKKHCTLSCGHGGEPDAECLRCTSCLGAWKGASPSAATWAAFPLFVGGHNPVSSYVCANGETIYRAAVPPAPPGCKLKTASVFLAPNASEPGALPIFEFLRTSEAGVRIWSPNKITSPGYKLVGSPFHGFLASAAGAAATTTAATTASASVLTVFPSVLCTSGRCDSFLSLDREEHKQCSTWDTAVPLSVLTAELDGYINGSLQVGSVSVSVRFSQFHQRALAAGAPRAVRLKSHPRQPRLGRGHRDGRSLAPARRAAELQVGVISRVWDHCIAVRDTTAVCHVPRTNIVVTMIHSKPAHRDDNNNYSISNSSNSSNNSNNSTLTAAVKATPRARGATSSTPPRPPCSPSRTPPRSAPPPRSRPSTSTPPRCARARRAAAAAAGRTRARSAPY